jgi:hypothetical protein
MHEFGGAGEIQLFRQDAEDLQLTNFHLSISNPDGIHPTNLLDEYKRQRETLSSGD